MAKIELSLDLLIPQAKKRLEELEQIIPHLQNSLKNPVNGNLRISKRGKNFNHYLILAPKDTHGKYILKKNISIAKKIAQRDYDEKILQELLKEIATLKKFLKHYNPNEIIKIWNKQSLGRRQLISPVQLPAPDFAARWQSLPNTGNPYAPENKIYQTAAGLYVRSKSEVLIANGLSACNVPFHYEKPLQFKSGKTIFPDFTCLNTSTRSEILWEHFGIMDEPTYAESAVSKIQELMKEGFLPGKNLIATFETRSCPLTPQIISKMIEEFLR